MWDVTKVLPRSSVLNKLRGEVAHRRLDHDVNGTSQMMMNSWEALILVLAI
jgi:hypothetical protein